MLQVLTIAEERVKVEAGEQAHCDGRMTTRCEMSICKSTRRRCPTMSCAKDESANNTCMHLPSRGEGHRRRRLGLCCCTATKAA